MPVVPGAVHAVAPATPLWLLLLLASVELLLDTSLTSLSVDVALLLLWLLLLVKSLWLLLLWSLLALLSVEVLLLLWLLWLLSDCELGLSVVLLDELLDALLGLLVPSSHGTQISVPQ